MEKRVYLSHYIYYKTIIIMILLCILSTKWNIVVEKNYTKHLLSWFELFMWEFWETCNLKKIKIKNPKNVYCSSIDSLKIILEEN